MLTDQLRSVVRNLPDAPPAMALLDRNGLLIEVNSELAALTGLAPAAHVGQTLVALLPAFAPALAPLLARVFANGMPLFDLELQEAGAVATSKRWLASLVPVRSQLGTLLGVDLALRPAATLSPENNAGLGLKHTRGSRWGYREAAFAVGVEQDEALFRRVVEQASFGVMLGKRDGSLSYLNSALARMLGYSNEEVASGRLRWSELTPPEFAARDREAMQELLRTGRCAPYEKTLLARDGRRVPVLLGAVLLQRASLNDWVAAVFVTELSALKEVEAERERWYEAERTARWAAERAATRASTLQTLTAALSRALTPEAVAAAVLDLGLDAIGASAGLVSLYDPKAHLLTTIGSRGYADEQVAEWRSLPLDQASPLGDVARRGVPIWAGSGTPRLQEYRRFAQMQHGQAQALATVPLALDSHLIGALSVAFDDERAFNTEERILIITLAGLCTQALERTRLYDAERAALAAEQEARAHAEEAVQLRDGFLSIAAHELRTPLTSLLGQAQLLQRRLSSAGQLNEPSARSLQVVVGQARRLSRLVGDLLDGARLELGQLAIEREPVNLSLLLRQIVEELQPALPNHQLWLDTPDEQFTVSGDAIRLEQVLQNLLSNAVKYSPSGSAIRLSLQRDAQQALVAVEDRGIGIPSDALPNLFERFYRVASPETQRVSGVGVGLYVVREIVRLHGGTVGVASVVGQGSTFTVALPLVSDQVIR